MEEVKTETKGWGVAALVFAIMSLLFIFLPFLGALFALLAIVMSFFQEDRLSRGAKRIAIISLVLNAFALLLFALFLGSALNKTRTTFQELSIIKQKVTHIEDKADFYEQQARQECQGTCVASAKDCQGESFMIGCPKDTPVCCLR